MANSSPAVVNEISGRAWIRNSDGSLTELHQGSKVPAGSDIVTASGATVSLQVENGMPIVIGEGREVAVNGDMTGPLADPTEAAVAPPSGPDSDRLLAALQAGRDPFDELDPTAAVVAGGGEAGGSSFVRLARILESTSPLDLAYPNPARGEDTLPRVSGAALTGDDDAVATPTTPTTPANNAPNALNDAGAGDQNSQVRGNLLGNDSDPDGDPLAITSINGRPMVPGGISVLGSTGGTFVVQPDGSYVFTPGGQYDYLAVGETATSTVSYTITDPSGATSTATVVVTVTGTNDGPVSSALTNQSGVDAQTEIRYDVSDRFSDTDTSDKLTFSATGLPPGLSIDPNTGIITGTIDHSASQGGNNGVYTVVVTATDPSGASTSQEFNWDVTNPAPTAVADNGTTDEDTSLTVDAQNGVLANDTDPDGDTLTVSQVNGNAANVGTAITGSNGGAFTLNADGSYSFNPGSTFQNLAAGETASSSITYTVSDGQGGTSTATLTVEITGTNDAPTVTALENRNNMDGDTVEYDLSGFFKDVDNGDVLTYSVDHVPGGLTFDETTGTFTGKFANWASDHTNTGVKGEYLITVTATDKLGASVSQTFLWKVGNPEPTAVADTNITTEDNVLVVEHRTEGVLGNDTDPDGDPLHVSEVNGVATGVGSAVTGSNGGTFTLNADGTYTFNPGSAFQNLGAGQTTTTSISYTVSDFQGATSTATLTVTVTGTNDTPILTPGVTLDNQASNDSDVVVDLDISKQFKDVDAGDKLSYSANGLPPGLKLDTATGLITGKIDSSASQGGNNGVYTVVITATDSHGAKVSQTFEWDVKNPAPTAADDAGKTDEDTSLTVTAQNGVLSNDSDADGDKLQVSAVNGQAAGVGTAVAGSDGGSFTLNADGSYTFNPGSDFQNLGDKATATTSITYTVTDADGATSTATLTITVTGTNDTPILTPGVSLDNQASNDSDVVVDLDISKQFKDVDAGDKLSYSANGLPPGLKLDTATGLITGKIDSSASQGGNNGVYTVVITATDSHGAKVSQTFEWDVKNPAPTAADDAGKTDEDTSLTVTAQNGVLSNDSDADGDKLQVSAVNGQAAGVGTAVAGSDGGSFTLNADGSYTFNPGSDFQNLGDKATATTSITYTVTDADGATSTATLTVTVSGTNDTPILTPGVSLDNQASNDSDVVVDLDISKQFKDVDAGDKLSYSANGLPPGLKLDPVTGLITGKIDSSASQGGNNGVYTVVITATDLSGAKVSQTFEWDVKNPAPTAADDAGKTDEDTSLTVTAQNGVLSNDSDADGDDLHVSAVNGQAAGVGTAIAGSNGGSFTLNADGSYSFNPGPDFQALNDGETKETSITYTVTDKDGASSTATLTVTITGQTDGPPVVTPVDSDGDVTSAHNSVVEGSGATVTGSVGVSAEAGITTVTVAGRDVTGANAANPVVITTDKGVLTVTGYNAATGVISYSYKEIGGADNHSAGDDSVRDSFKVTVTDLAGKSTSNDLVVQIVDTAPVAKNDSASVTEDTATPITGNVLTNDTLGADKSTVAITTADAKYGKLVDNGDGTWSYQLNNGLPAVQALNNGQTLTETIHYTITDADGDKSEAVLTITINGQTDGPPVVTPVDSDGNVTSAHNSVVEGSGATVTGSVGVSAEAGITTVTVAGRDVTGANAANPVVITTDKGVLTVTGYNAATGVISYSYKEIGGADNHSAGDDSVRDSFKVTVTDLAGKSTSNDLVVQIVDTAPVAKNDSASVTEDTATPISGNVLTNDTLGADKSTVAITTGDAKYGKLVDNGDGTWSYQLNNGLPAVQALNNGQTLTETIRYTITDADGDKSEAVLTITINGQTDGPPVVTPVDSDGNVTSAHNSVVEGSGATVTGSVGVSAEAGITTVTVAGRDVTGANAANPVVITTDKGVLTVTGYNAATGVISYSYKEIGGADNHSAGDDSVRDSFKVTVTDLAGKSTSNDLVVQIVDTAPVAKNDSASVTEDTATPITGNVLTNDTLGADKSTVAITTADAKYGKLVDNGDGTWSYQLNNGLPAVQALNNGQTLTETIRYTITDADGDKSEAVLTITINGQTDGPPVVTPVDSDGDVTSAHNSVVEGSGATVTGSVGVSAEAGITTVTVAGRDVTGANAANPVVITTDKGVLTVTGYNAATGVISYSYKEIGGADNHSAGDDSVRDSFKVTVTDLAGKSTSNDLVVQIVDTAPVAKNDSASVTEDTATPITGNVLTNDTLGADKSTVAITTADAKYGKLVDNGDGTWSYQLNNGLPAVQALNNGQTLTETIRYTITDADGDKSEAVLTITINGQTDGPPVVTPVDSDGNVTSAHNSVVEGSGATVTGSVGVSAEAGITTVTVAGRDVTGANAANPVVITTDKGILTVTGYNAATGVISYSYKEIGGADNHSAGDDSVRDSFKVTVTDLAGKSTSNDLVVQIVDTAPVAKNDSASVTEDTATPITGNVLTNDTLGADKSTVAITTADAKYGKLVDNGDGTWSYQLNNGLPAVQALNNGQTLTETIRYTITDADGDKSEAVLTITINGQTDGPPVVTPVDSDGNVTSAHNSVVEGSGATVTGSVGVSAEAGITTVTVAGRDVTGANAANPVVITTDKGILTVTGYNAATGVISYSYKEIGGADNHSAGDNSVRDNFTVKVTDLAGKSTSNDLVIQIIDTAPIAKNDAASVTEDATMPINGNVLANDTLGADKSTVAITTTDAKYGKLVDNGDGTWSYQLNNGLPAVQALNNGQTLTETIRYTITDADGDKSEATLTITINGTNDAPVLQAHTKEILEDQTATGNVLQGATDVDSKTLIVTEFTVNGVRYEAGKTATIAGVGTLLISANGSYTFKPDANWNGDVPQVKYTVSDGAASTTSTLDIDVLPVNDAPVSQDGSGNVTEGKTYTFDADDFPFSDPVEGHTFTSVIIDSLPTGGTLMLNGKAVTEGQEISAADIQGGKLVFQASPSNVGENAGSSFDFRVKDSGGTANGGQNTSAEQTFNLHVDQFVGGNNTDDTVKGGSGNDVLLGDQGGMVKNVTPGTSYNIALVLDLSGSMNDKWGSGSAEETRLATAKKALRSLLEGLVDHDGTINISLITFKGTTSTLQTSISDLDNGNLDQIVDKILGLSASGNTPYGAAFNEATDWFDDQPKVDAYGKPYQNLTFFLTDGEPSDGSSGRDKAFDDLAAVSQVHGIGIGDGVSVSTLDKYDNTGATFSTGGTVYANFSNTQGLNNVNNWDKTGAGSLSRVDVGFWSSDYRMRITDTNSSNGAAYTVTMAEAQKMVVTAASGASFSFNASLSNQNAGDTFEWRLLMKVGSEWKVVEKGSQADTTTGIHGPGEYRFQFAVNDKSSGSSFYVDIDDIRTYTSGRTGQSQVVTNPSDLESALVGGSTTTELAPVGNDKIYGGEGSDILFGDAINTDQLPWGVNGNPAKPADFADGSGLDGLKLFLLLKNGTQPTDADLHKFILDNHGLFDVQDDTRGGNDELHGGSGNDILYGQGGDDTLFGEDGNDILYGGVGKDTLHGGAGNDILIGGKGDDILYGGDGSDTFKWEFGDQGTKAQPAVDVIKDFSNATIANGGDVLDLRDMLQGEKDGTLTQYLHFSKDPANSANTVIEISTDGKIGQGADQKIILENVDLTNGGKLATDQAIINDLLQKGKLNVDHS